MPILFSNRRPFFAKRPLLVLLSLVLASPLAPAQTLARPGWAGSGITPETWWRRAVFYRIDTPDFPTAEALTSLQAFGFDGILLTPEALTPPQTPPDASNTPNASGTPQPLSLDDLFSECSRRHLHVLVSLDLTAAPASTLALAKSWLYRGASGFVLIGLDKISPSATTPADPTTTHHHSIHLAKSAEPAVLTSLHTLLAKFSSDKILISATPSAFPDVQLQIVTLAPATAPGDTVNNRTLLALSDPTTLTPVDAARLLLTPAAAVLDSAAIPTTLLTRAFPPPAAPVEPEAAPAPPPPPPPSNVYGAYVPYVSKDTPEARRKKAAEEAAAKEAATIEAEMFPVQSDYEPISETPVGFLAYYHRLVQMHHTAEALPDGAIHAVTPPSPAIAWAILHPGKPPMVVVLNPSSTKQQLDMTASLRGIVTPRLAFRTLSHTAASSGVVHPDRVEVGPQGVYAGELLPGFVYR